MKIAIIGPGALGCLLAALLVEAGEDARLVDYRPDRVALLRRQGLRLHTPEGDDRQIAVPIGLPQEVGPADVAIVAVKAHQTRAAARDLPRLLAAGGLALTLQNGLGNVEIMAERRWDLSVCWRGSPYWASPGRRKVRLSWPAGGPSLSASRRARRHRRRSWPGWWRRCAGPAWSAGKRRTSRRSCGKSS